MQDKLKRIYAKMGFVEDQSGILRRYNRETTGWNIHLQNTQQFILKNIPTNAKTAIILGSGYLLDVPINALLNQFEHISLVDINHPTPIRKQWENHPQITLLETDLTGIAEPLYQYLKSTSYPDDSLLNIFNLRTLDINLNAYDYIVSCNLLSQLDVLLTDYIRDNYDISEELLQQFRLQIETNHYNDLPPTKSVLITDYDEIYIHPKKETQTYQSVILDKVRTAQGEHWYWIFDTKAKYINDCQTNLSVIAIKL